MAIVNKTDSNGYLETDLMSVGTSTLTLGSKTSANSIPVVIASDQGAIPASQSGTWTIQPGNTANTTPWLIKPHDGSNPLFSVAAALADTTSNPTIGGIGAFPMLYNGSTWDRMPGDKTNGLWVNIKAGAGSGGTAIADNAAFTAGTTQGTPAFGFYHSTIDTVTDGHSAALAIDSKRNLFTVLRDAAGNARGVNVTSANELLVNVNNSPSVNQAGTWTIQPGNTANTTPWLMSINQGGNTATVASFTNSKALAVEIVDASGNQITSFGGSGGNAAASATGSAVPADADYLGLNVGGNLRGWTGVNPTGSVYAGQLDIASVVGTTAVTAASGVLLVGNADGAGNKLTTNSTTYTSKFALDINLLGALGTAFSTAGKVDIKGADGDVFIRQATAANLNATVVGTGTFAVQAAQSGNWTSRIVGNSGAILDATIGAGTAPSNMIVTGGVYNTSAPAPTNGQSMAIQFDQAGNTRSFPGIALTTLSVWNSSTSVNATQNIFTNSGCPAVLVQVNQTTTLTGGAITFEVTYDGTNWVTAPANTVLDPTSTSYAQISIPYTLQANTNKPFIISNNGWQGLRIKLSTAITGTGTITPYYALLAYDPIESTVVYSPTAANFNVTLGAGVSTIGGVNQAGTWTVQPGNTANTTPWLFTINQGGNSANVTSRNSILVEGPTASGSSLASAPVTTGGLAKTSLPTAVSDGQVVSRMHDKFGRQIVLNNAMRDIVKPITQLTLTTTTETTLISAVASVFNDIVSLSIINTSATVVQVDFRDSTAGTIRYSFEVPPTDGRGISLNVPMPQNAVNNNWTAKLGGAVSSVIITGSYIANA